MTLTLTLTLTLTQPLTLDPNPNPDSIFNLDSHRNEQLGNFEQNKKMRRVEEEGDPTLAKTFPGVMNTSFLDTRTQ
jgi:hypothetical protein